MSHPVVRVAHCVEGRIRLKVKHGKGNPEVLNTFAEKFRALPGIESVEANPVTGAVVLTYDPDRHREFVGHVERHASPPAPLAPAPPKTDIDKLADAIEGEAEYLAQHSHAARAFFDAVKSVDREIKAVTNNNIDLKIVLAGGVIAATILEIGATAATPVWVTLLLFGTNHYVELHSKPQKQPNREADAELRGTRLGDGAGRFDAENRIAQHPGNGGGRPGAASSAARKGNGADNAEAAI